MDSYLEAHYSDKEEASILKELEKRADAQMNKGKKNQLWDEHFYLLLFLRCQSFFGGLEEDMLFALLLIFFPLPFASSMQQVSRLF